MASIKANCRKVMCIGRNYADHISELSSARPKQPFFFLKPPSSILPPLAGPVLHPRGVSVHYEVELGLIIGKTIRDLRAEDKNGAMDAIAGYCVAIDMTGRNVQNEAKKKGLPWSIAKGFDTFLPVSEYIKKERIPDPGKVRLSLKVNGETRQDDSTELMLFDIPRQLADISQVMTLESGDLVLTGTPKGVGEVKAGDKITCAISSNGSELAEGRIEVDIVDREGPYQFRET